MEGRVNGMMTDAYGRPAAGSAISVCHKMMGLIHWICGSGIMVLGTYWFCLTQDVSYENESGLAQ